MVAYESLIVRYSDGYEAHARLWVPAEPRGAVLYLHGIQSHGGWFMGSAERMAEAGYAVLLPDRRGSGRNDVERGHTPSARRLLRDVAEGLDELHVRTGLEQAHLVGVSWGGKLALAMTRYLPARLAGVVLVAPGLFPRVDLSAGQKVRVALTAVMARQTYFPIPLDSPDLFTANPARQAFIRDDPLALHEVTTAFLLASRKLDRYAQSAGDQPRDLPLSLFLAGRDRIIDNDRTRDFVRRLPWPRRRIFEYPDAHHTLDFEPDPASFFEDLAGALDTVPSPSAGTAGPSESLTERV